MSIQSNDQLSSLEPVPIDIDSEVVIGIPSISELQQLQVTGCTAGDIELYNQVERSIECAIASEGPNVGPLGQAYVLGEVASRPPISCMIDLVTDPNSECGVEIPSNKRKAAFNAFSEVTGYKPINLSQSFNHITSTQKKILNFNAFYIFFPIFLLGLIVIWLMVGVGWIDWIVGLFLTALSFLILYGFSMAYRIHAQNFLNNENNQLQNDANAAQTNFENSIAYWPQGLFAVACAVTATGGTGWTCNEPGDCPTCPPVGGSISSSNEQLTKMGGVCGSSVIKTKIVNKEEKSKTLRKRRSQRRKRSEN